MVGRSLGLVPWAAWGLVVAFAVVSAPAGAERGDQRFAEVYAQRILLQNTLRDWLETLDWDKEPPAPDLPPDLVEKVSQRYLEVCEKITGQSAAEVVA